MCGISGVVYRDPAHPVDRELLRRVTSVLSHRGPDADGFFWGPGAGLGHRRLSIIDLGESGNQPMSNEDGSLWLVLNGEIYGFHELRTTLAQAGHHVGIAARRGGWMERFRFVWYPLTLLTPAALAGILSQIPDEWLIAHPRFADADAQRAAYLGLSLVWDLPVPYSADNPVAQETIEDQVPSGAGKAWLYVEPDGDVLPTQGSSATILGNLLRDEWKNIYR